MDSSDIHIVPNLLILVGLTSVGINIWAGKVCQDSLDASRFPRWKNILTPFFCISLFFTSLLLVAMILSYALQPSLEESLKVGLKNGIRFYKVRKCTSTWINEVCGDFLIIVTTSHLTLIVFIIATYYVLTYKPLMLFHKWQINARNVSKLLSYCMLLS